MVRTRGFMSCAPVTQTLRDPNTIRADAERGSATGVVDGLVEQLFATENDYLTTKQVNPGLAEHAVAISSHAAPLRPRP